MRGESESIGWALAFEFAPAAIFGGAVAFASATYLAQPQISASPLAAGAAALGGVWLALNKFGSPRQQFAISEFEQTPIETEMSALGELLEQADVVGIVEQLGAFGEQSGPAEELVLDDVLASVESDSRVVRLFEPNDTAGEMHARIEDHLRSSPRQTPPDATQELHDALAALRRSLR
jgi:hypothetical protein